MSGDLADARAALAEHIERLTHLTLFSRDANIVRRLEPLLEPSDAERKLEQIRAATPWSNHVRPCQCLPCRIWEIIQPPTRRAPQVGDTVLVKGFGKRKVVSIRDDGTFDVEWFGSVRANSLNMNLDDCEVVE